MALLTAADILHKKFETKDDTYDAGEVDDYLDVVAATVRDLTDQLAAANARIADLEAAPAPVVFSAPKPVFAPPAAPADAPAPVDERPTPPAAEAPVDAPAAAVGLLELARKIHDEHIAEATAAAQRLLNDAHASAETIVADATAQADALVTDARQAAARDLDALTTQREQLQTSVSDLRDLETTFRTRLTDELNHLLEQVKPTA